MKTSSARQASCTPISSELSNTSPDSWLDSVITSLISHWCWAPLSVHHQNLCEHFIWNFQYSAQDHFQQFMSHSVWILGYWRVRVSYGSCSQMLWLYFILPIILLCSGIVPISHYLSFLSNSCRGPEIRFCVLVQKYSRWFLQRCCYEKAMN